ncbi:hypothetical protein ACIQXZ_23405 [Bacillus thuringiensis]|uniref:hypothetical protein n=1 Tax=Bacillus thuringiensis TaxID=1428 RepID=UPI003811EC42
MRNNWQMYRVKLFNFWYYEDEEFYFKSGSGVLRGHNGSGKSITTQSVITMLLDGDTRPHRLDPFGSRQRTLRDTVLGEEGLLGLQERIGYVVLECKRRDSEVYKTIGMGVHAQRSKGTPNVWYFILDGARVGGEEHEIALYTEIRENGKPVKVPWGEKDLRTVCMQHGCGRVYRDRKEYARDVNRGLFGFDNPERYSELLELLQQARSPKLSDQNRPEGVVEVLNASLPQLTAEELRPLTDTIESIDNIERDIVTGKEHVRLIKRLGDVYHTHYKFTLAEKAKGWLDTKREVAEFITNLNNLEQTIESCARDIEQHTSALVGIQEQYHATIAEIRRLNKETNVHDLIVELEGWKNKKEESRNEVTRATEREEKSKQTLLRLMHERRRIEDKYETLQDDLQEHLQELNELYEEMDYTDHIVWRNHFKEKHETYDFIGWKKDVNEYRNGLKAVLKKLHEIQGKQQLILIRQNEWETLQEQIRTEEKTLHELGEACDEAAESVYERIQEWRAETSVLCINDHTAAQLLKVASEWNHSLSADYFHRIWKRTYQAQREVLSSDILAAQHNIEVLKTAQNKIHKAYESWLIHPELVPPFYQLREGEWEELDKQSIPYVRFCEAFEYREHVDESQQLRLQQTLEEAGLLYSVIVAPEDVEAASQYTSVLLYRKEAEHNMSQYLVLSKQKNVHAIHLSNILAGISIIPDAQYVGDAGTFRNGFTEGTAHCGNTTVYIGTAARKRAWEQKRDELESELHQAEQELEEGETFLVCLQKQLETLDHESQNHPNLNKLQQQHEDWQKIHERLEHVLYEQRSNIKHVIEDLQREVNRVLATVAKQTAEQNLPLTVEAYAGCEEAAQQYGDVLRDLENTQRERERESDKMKQWESNINEETDREELFRDQHHDAKREFQRCEANISSLQVQLDSIGHTDLIARLQELQTIAERKLPEEKKKYEKLRMKCELDQNRALEEKEVLTTRDLPFQRELERIWGEAFHMQWNERILRAPDGITHLSSIAKWVWDTYRNSYMKQNDQRNKNVQRLDEVYHTCTGVLARYSMHMREVALKIRNLVYT